MNAVIWVCLGAALLLVSVSASRADEKKVADIGSEEFGLTPKALVAAVQKVEASIASCMRSHGFEYVAVDYNTVRRGMTADKILPGMSEEEFVAAHGFGVATLYTGVAPQLATGYGPGREGLGKRNVEIFKGLSAADQAAYNHALFGENTGMTFAVGLETENFALTGGCTRAAVEKVFAPEQLLASYYNPKDAIVNNDPRMRAALRTYAGEMRKAGFEYSHPDEVEHDVRMRLAALTAGGTIPVAAMTSSQRAALLELQSYERRVAVKSMQLTTLVVDPVAEKIIEELYARKPQ